MFTPVSAAGAREGPGATTTLPRGPAVRWVQGQPEGADHDHMLKERGRPRSQQALRTHLALPRRVGGVASPAGSGPSEIGP